MGIEDLAIALASQQSAQNRIAESNPYLQLQNIPDTIGNIAMKAAGSGTAGIGESALVSGISGLLSGGLGLAGQNYQQSATQDYSNALADALAGRTPSAGGLSNSLFADARNQASLFNAQRQLKQLDLNDSYEREKKLSILNRITQNPDMADEILAAAAKIDGGSAPSAQVAPMAAETPSVDIATDAPDPLGRETLKERTDKLILEGRRKLNMTPNQAFEYANKFTRPDELQVKTALKKIEESRKRASLLGELANTAKAGIAGAGETGGFIVGPIRDLASKALAAAGSKEQTAKQSAQKNLNSIAPQLVGMSRSPGAVSDFENKIAIEAGPNAGNTPEANMLLADKMQAIAEVENDYANFIESYVNKYADVRDADKYWAQYKKDNPIFVQDPTTGEYYVNKNRTPISEYDFTGTSKKEQAQEEPLGLSPSTIKVIGGNTYYQVKGGWRLKK